MFGHVEKGGEKRRAGAVWVSFAFLICAVVSPLQSTELQAETCITQSQMKATDRDAIVTAARTLAAKIQEGDAAGLRAQTIPEYAKDFSAMTALVGSTSAKVKGAPLSVDQVYLLDASNLKAAPDGTNQDAQFFCSLNKSMAEANFLIPALPAGKYGFVSVTADSAKTPWRLSFLLRQDAAKEGQWSMAGFYPKPLTAAGHDGLWYWIHARELAQQKQRWNAYLYYGQAEALLQPVGFLTSTHFEKLRKEAAATAPPALSEGISADTPLVVKGQQGAEYRFTELTTDDSLGMDKLDIVVHLQAEPGPDAALSATTGKSQPAKAAAAVPLSPRERNSGAMAALLSAYPELRNTFHGVWVFAETPGKNPFVTEAPMENIH